MTTNIERFMNREAAWHHIEKIKDPDAKAFVNYGVTTVLLNRRIPEGAAPLAPLDLMYLCLVFESMYANKGAIELILQGRAEELSLLGSD